MNWLCKRCKHENVVETSKCLNCGFWHTDFHVEIEGITSLEDAEDVEEDRIKTGPWDACFGGGIVKDSLIMIGGRPGAGKSTLMLHMTEAFTVDSDVLYANCEESKGQIKSRAKRLGIKRLGKIKVVKRSDFNLEHALDSVSPGLVILDSLPGLVGIGPSGYNDALNVLRELKQYAEDNECPVIVIEHVTQALDISGLMAYQHVVDTTLLFYPESEEEEESPRILKTLKNRHGPAFVKTKLMMTGKGLSPMKEGKKNG